MPQPQPGADRPADGGTPVTGRGPGTDEPARAPVPPSPGDGHAADDLAAGPPDPPPAAGSSPADAPAAAGSSLMDDSGHEPDAPDVGDRHDAADRDDAVDSAEAPRDGTADEPAVTPARGSAPVRPTGAAAPVRPTGAAAVPGQPSDPTPVPGRPDPTRVAGHPDPTRVETHAETPAPRWSGSAPVPPPPPRKPAWGESAEPTPVPRPDSPEHLVPVDPWAGVDTTGWDLHSVDLPALPPTLPYPTPQHLPPYPVPAPAPAAHPVPPAPPVPTRAASAPPAPASPPRPASTPPKQRRRRPTPPVTAPPGWRPPKGYVAVPVRRRRRWPWVLLLTVACCCGVPLWWVQPMSSQYPADAALPDQMRGLRLRSDARSQATAEQLRTEVSQAHLLAEDTFAGIYGTRDGKWVILFGGTGFRLTPEADAEAEIARLKDRYALAEAVPVDTGVRGRYERCAIGRVDGDAVVVCTSVDHGSLATGVFTRLSLEDSGRLLDTLRAEVVTPTQP